MTPKQIALVQASWKEVQRVAEPAAKLFYSRLFALEPSVRALFRGDMKEQGRKLMTMITVAVNSLSHLESMMPTLQTLGRRHARYGVEDRHYALVEEALVWTLGQGLGDAFTKELETAWRTACNALASAMMAATAREAA